MAECRKCAIVDLQTLVVISVVSGTYVLNIVEACFAFYSLDGPLAAIIGFCGKGNTVACFG